MNIKEKTLNIARGVDVGWRVSPQPLGGERMKTYVRYQDDGPIGICGQICAVTNPWDQLHIFTNEDEANEFMKKVESATGRKNSRVTAMWVDDPDQMYPSVRE